MGHLDARWMLSRRHQDLFKDHGAANAAEWSAVPWQKWSRAQERDATFDGSRKTGKTSGPDRFKRSPLVLRLRDCRDFETWAPYLKQWQYVPVSFSGLAVPQQAGRHRAIGGRIIVPRSQPKKKQEEPRIPASVFYRELTARPPHWNKAPSCGTVGNTAKRLILRKTRYRFLGTGI